jgi:hypothetical protein
MPDVQNIIKWGTLDEKAPKLEDKLEQLIKDGHTIQQVIHSRYADIRYESTFELTLRNAIIITTTPIKIRKKRD